MHRFRDGASTFSHAFHREKLCPKIERSVHHRDLRLNTSWRMHCFPWSSTSPLWWNLWRLKPFGRGWAYKMANNKQRAPTPLGGSSAEIWVHIYIYIVYYYLNGQMDCKMPTKFVSDSQRKHGQVGLAIHEIPTTQTHRSIEAYQR